MNERRTKRRYANELYPHPEEGETRPLAVEIPYLYANMVGHEIWDTSWFAIRDEDALRSALQRLDALSAARHIALLADALHQGLTGDEAWVWTCRHMQDYSDELVYERATHYGVPVDQIKPYPCGPEPDQHDHHDAPDGHGQRTIDRIVHHINGKESECPECTEDIPDEVATA